MTVTVVVLRVAKFESTESNIRRAFRDSMFDIHYVDGKINNYCDALETLEGKNHCIVVKDVVKTTLSSKKIAKEVQRMIRVMKSEDADLCYLTRYLDQCQMMTCVDASDKFTLSKTMSPFGDECILFSPRGRKIVTGKKSMDNGKKLRVGKSVSDALNDAIEDGNISAIACSPTLFQFDIDNATSNSDYEKRCECAPIQLLADPVDNGMGTAGLIFLIVTFFIVLAVAWALIRVGPNN